MQRREAGVGVGIGIGIEIGIEGGTGFGHQQLAVYRAVIHNVVRVYRTRSDRGDADNDNARAARLHGSRGGSRNRRPRIDSDTDPDPDPELSPLAETGVDESRFCAQSDPQTPTTRRMSYS